MGRKLYISDCHFGHVNVIKFDGRPFETVEEMDEYMIKTWNENVTKQDDVFILGDFSMHTATKTTEILKRLNGRKHLVQGNHDRWLNAKNKKMLVFIDRYRVIKDNERKIILSHFPMPLYLNNNIENYVHLFGHVHSSKEETLIGQFRSIAMNELGSYGNLFNIGAMLPYMSYIPRELDYIMEHGKKRWEMLSNYVNEKESKNDI